MRAGATWADYYPALISRGGGVYPRAAKAVALSAEVKEALALQAERLTPAELIRALLQAPVDLLWNGGIGTFVKAQGESHAEIGDRSNDGVRVDAHELRCRVIAEGGNLGLTQRGRIEYARRGGRLNTDAIDNCGGVDCSDREVNLKIPLNAAAARGDLSEQKREQILAEMSEEVAGHVLQDCFRQVRAISIAEADARSQLEGTSGSWSSSNAKDCSIGSWKPCRGRRARRAQGGRPGPHAAGNRGAFGLCEDGPLS